MHKLQVGVELLQHAVSRGMPAIADRLLANLMAAPFSIPFATLAVGQQQLPSPPSGKESACQQGPTQPGSATATETTKIAGKHTIGLVSTRWALQKGIPRASTLLNRYAASGHCKKEYHEQAHSQTGKHQVGIAKGPRAGTPSNRYAASGHCKKEYHEQAHHRTGKQQVGIAKSYHEQAHPRTGEHQVALQ
jgi:hypothetical protein